MPKRLLWFQFWLKVLCIDGCVEFASMYFLRVTEVMQQFKGIRISKVSLPYNICSFFLQILNIIGRAASSVSVWPSEHFVSHQGAFGYLHCSFCMDARRLFFLHVNGFQHDWVIYSCFPQPPPLFLFPFPNL